MFDRDMSGTIDINEFTALWHYIQQWRTTFQQFDSNRSGSIEAHELQQGKNRLYGAHGG
jgi:Ca2+-binding EF-hand superfamily protein